MCPFSHIQFKVNTQGNFSAIFFFCLTLKTKKKHFFACDENRNFEGKLIQSFMNFKQFVSNFYKQRIYHMDMNMLCI